MDITSPIVLAFAVGLALAGPLLLVLTWQRRPRGLLGGIIRFVAVLLCQVLALGAGLLAANREYDFYSSWHDLLGGGGQQQDGGLSTNELPVLPPGDGQLVVRTVRLGGTGLGATRLQVVVWLPPQYRQKSMLKQKFPVMMMLPGQPSTPFSVIKKFEFPEQAAAAIKSGKIKPFIAVFPPIMIDPPRDTECTDVPNGPQAESWLTKSVRTFVIHQFRASSSAADWAVAGWSTGGYCAAKLLLRHPDLFNAAISIGGYFNATEDNTTGDLWGGNRQFRNENSPRWLIKQDPGRTVNLLIVTSKQDRDSYVSGAKYADSKAMIGESLTVPGVSTLLLQTGGHNYGTYVATLPQCFAWLGRILK